MTTDSSDLAQRRSDLTARIAGAREALNFVDRSELEAAQYVAQLRSIAAGNGPRNVRRKAAQDAQRIEVKIGKDIVAGRASTNAVLVALRGELAALVGPEEASNHKQHEGSASC